MMPRLAIACLAAVIALAVPAVVHGDAVVDGNLQAQSSILGPGPTAHGSTLSYAMVHGAIYDAVNGGTSRTCAPRA